MTTSDISTKTKRRARRSKRVVLVGLLIVGLFTALVASVVQTAREAGQRTHCI